MNAGPLGHEPPIAELTAPLAWHSIDFISDLHLAADMPQTFAAWRAYVLNTQADAVFILGDLFDAWVGDDARHAGFEATAAAVLKQAAVRRPVAFMAGNRDFLLGREMLDDCGATLLADPTLLNAFRTRTLLSHGDAWCLADTEYQQLRRTLRDPAWQQRVLALTIAERRELAGRMRTASERRAATLADSTPASASAGGNEIAWFDVDVATARRYLSETGAGVLVHGHTHRPASETLGPGIVRHVLSDWDLDHEPDAPRAEVLRWSAAGWARLSPQQAASAGTG